MDSLARKAKSQCGGSWSESEAADLIFRDLVPLEIDDIVPALFEVINVSIDQAALTSESLPQSKKLGRQYFS